MSSIRTDLSGQVAIVTGSTSGIGAAMADAWAAAGLPDVLLTLVQGGRATGEALVAGEDVTRQMDGCIGVPQQLAGDPSRWPEVLEVRGEVFIADEDFERVNRARETNGMRLFKNARNAASGAMRRLERPAGDGTDAGPLRFLAYGHGEVVGAGWSSQSEFLEWLPALGLAPVPVLRVSESLDDVVARAQARHLPNVERHGRRLSSGDPAAVSR